MKLPMSNTDVENPPSDIGALVVHLLQDGESREIELPHQLAGRVERVGAPGVAPLRALWKGESSDDYGYRATMMTAAAALVALEPGLEFTPALQRADALWEQRDTARVS